MKRSACSWYSGQWHFVLRLALFSVLLFSLEPFARAQSKDVLTYHNDLGRTGQYLVETTLTPANVNTNTFGKLWVLNVDGKVDAEPLYAANVSIPGKGVHNVLIVATEHDSVYAFDADSTNLLWQVTMLGSGQTTANNGCSQVTPEVGITSTPVIDRQAGPNGTIFLVACTSTSGTIAHNVHALDLATGTNRIAAVTVSASYPGTGDYSSGGNVIFEPSQYEDRPALLLLNGVIYTTWASHCDGGLYTGWMIGYNENTLAQTSILDVTPNGSKGAVWMAGDGPAADVNSNIYFLDANGTFDSTLNASGNPSSGDFGNGFLKISTTNGAAPAVVDYFATYTNIFENNNDEDLGSGGEILLPGLLDTNGVTRYLGVGAGKDEAIYIVDTSNMGKFNAENNNAIYQYVTGALGGGVFSSPAWFNGTLYYGAVGDHLRAFPFQNARLKPSSSQSAIAFSFPGATPGISANGTSNGIVWVTGTNSSGTYLCAFNATNLAVELYDNHQAPNNRDFFGGDNKYITPMIANGKVYVGTTTGVGVFGLLNQTSPEPVQLMAYVQQPSNSLAGAVITPGVEVEAIGTNSQPDPGATITVSLNGTGTLGGTLAQIADLNGIAHFNDLTVSQPGQKSLTATAGAGPASPTNSAAFTVFLPASALAFTTQPGLATNGAPFSPPPVVQTVDSTGDPSTADLPAVLNIQITLTNSTGTLFGITTYNIGTTGSNGVVTLTGLGINGPGTNDQLVVSVVTSASPTNTVPGAVLWLDAADSTTLTTNATKVQAWMNKGSGGAGVTGTNLWFTQNTASLQPTITYNALHGLPVLTFSDNGEGEGAGSTYLGNLAGSYTNSGSQMTYFAVATESENTTENWRAPVSFATAGQGDGQGVAGVVILTDGDEAAPYPLAIQRDHPGTPEQADIPVPPANGTAFAMTFSDNAGTAILYYTDINGNFQTNGANIVNGISPYTYGITEVTVGSRIEPPTGTTIDNGWDGNVAEVLVYNTALNPADRASVESYLKSKWFGTAGSGPTLSNALSAPFDVESLAATPPRQNISGVVLNGNGSVTLGYATTPSFHYHVETTTNLSNNSWTTVTGSPTNATGTSVTFTDTTSSSAAARFYRIVSP